jgi:hypothetical protein
MKIVGTMNSGNVTNQLSICNQYKEIHNLIKNFKEAGNSVKNQV